MAITKSYLFAHLGDAATLRESISNENSSAPTSALDAQIAAAFDREIERIEVVRAPHILQLYSLKQSRSKAI